MACLCRHPGSSSGATVQTSSRIPNLSSKSKTISDSNQIRSLHSQNQSQFTFKDQDQIKSHHNFGNLESFWTTINATSFETCSKPEPVPSWEMNVFLPAHTAQGISQLLRPRVNEFDFDLDQGNSKLFTACCVTKIGCPVFVSLRWVQTRKPWSRLGGHIDIFLVWWFFTVIDRWFINQSINHSTNQSINHLNQI